MLSCVTVAGHLRLVLGWLASCGVGRCALVCATARAHDPNLPYAGWGTLLEVLTSRRGFDPHGPCSSALVRTGEQCFTTRGHPAASWVARYRPASLTHLGSIFGRGYPVSCRCAFPCAQRCGQPPPANGLPIRFTYRLLSGPISERCDGCWRVPWVLSPILCHFMLGRKGCLAAR